MTRSQQLTRRNFFNMNWMGLSKCIWKTSKIMALHNTRLLAKHCQDFSTRPFTEEPNRAWFQHKNIIIFSTLSHFKFFMLKSLSLIWERSYFPSNRLYKKRKKKHIHHTVLQRKTANMIMGFSFTCSWHCLITTKTGQRYTKRHVQAYKLHAFIKLNKV
jgi:hypothetical protein